MSNATSSASTSAEVVQIAREIYRNDVGVYVNISMLALLLYDSILTFGEEVTYVWDKKIRLGSILYFCSKWGMILSFSGLLGLNFNGASYNKICTPMLALTNIGFWASVTGWTGTRIISILVFHGAKCEHGVSHRSCYS